LLGEIKEKMEELWAQFQIGNPSGAMKVTRRAVLRDARFYT